MKKTSNKAVKRNFKTFLLSLAFIGFTIFQSFAHCDSYDGPVIQDALQALKENNVELVLKWVEPKHEKEIRDKFHQTLRLRGKNKELNELLERNFLETLVRLHREGEGAPYTGIKPAGSMTPLVAMADQSIISKDAEHMIHAVTEHLEKIIRERYSKVLELSKIKNNSVADGRRYVEAYVEYTHTLEGLEHLLSGDLHHNH
ncbi:MAG TPA: DUF6448 family protein [Flavobacteriaceae bacterium]|nr:DUF6448 family protein [Flavobacteriaceae bacterium]